MKSTALAELCVKLEQNATLAMRLLPSSALTWSSNSQWEGPELDWNNLSYLQIYFNRKWHEWAVIVLGGQGYLDDKKEHWGSSIMLIGYKLKDPLTPDQMKALYDAAPAHLK